METELKLAVSVEQVEAIKKLSLLQKYGAGAVQERHLVSTYFDTPALELHEQKVSLRIRDKEDGWVRTVKTAGSSERGLHRRNEFEVPLSKPELDLELLDQLGIEVISQAIRQHRLQPLFVTDFVRSLWILEAPQGGSVEFAVDLGEVRLYEPSDNVSVSPISEIELELTTTDEHADPAFLFLLADEIRAAGIEITPDDESKAARGYRLNAVL
ncbi:MAG: CYTH domain-containing protein [Gammaproteobacteria bacterium]|jgi:triphosphatase|nr:CYTH domain-containing protein [Gammaproteobacteria bacterium]